MPNRIIKESICTSKGLSECSLFAEDLFKRLIVYADDYGRFNADTEIMLARLYPRELQYITEADIVDALIELSGIGKVAFYTATSRKEVYGCFPKWEEHQRVRNVRSECPDPDDTTVNDWYLRRFISADLRERIIERDGFKCQICGKYLTTMRDAKRFAKLGRGLYHIDHVVPVVQGGRATEENLRLTCPACNLSRNKRFSMDEIIEFDRSPQLAATCGDLPQPAVRIQSNPIRIQSESESEKRAREREMFARFWDAYPKKVGKGAAEKAFAKIGADIYPLLIPALEKQKKSAQWQKDGGQYVPNPATWLNQERWLDEIRDPVPRGGRVQEHNGSLTELQKEAVRKLMDGQ